MKKKHYTSSSRKYGTVLRKLDLFRARGPPDKVSLCVVFSLSSGRQDTRPPMTVLKTPRHVTEKKLLAYGVEKRLMMELR